MSCRGKYHKLKSLYEGGIIAMRGRIFVAALLVIALAVVAPAFAGQRESLGDANWTGPLETPNPNTLPKNSFYVETYFGVEQDNGVFNHSGTQMRAPYDNDYFSETLFTYAVTNRFNLQILPEFDGASAKDPGGFHTNGLEAGNLMIRFPFQLFKFKEKGTPLSFTITPGFNAPTGTGVGNVWEPFFGLWAQRPFWMPGGRILRVRGAQSFFFPVSKTYNASSGVCGTGITSCTQNGRKYFKTQIGMEYSLTKHWVPAWDFYWKYGDGTVLQTQVAGGTKQLGCSTFTTTTGGCDTFNRLVIDPALEYNINGNVGVIFGVEMTVSGRNVGSYIAPQIALQWFKP